MARRWPRWSARKASAPNAGGPSPAALPDPNPEPQTAGSSPSVRITASSPPAAPSSVSAGVRVVSSPASWTDYYSGLVVSNGTWRPGRGVPPPLDAIGPDVMLAVATVRGPEPWQWREAAPGAFMAWPDAIGASCAEEMTAAQLRAILAARDSHG